MFWYRLFSVPSFLLKISYNGAQLHLGPLAIYPFTLVTINHRFTTLVLGSIQFTDWLNPNLVKTSNQPLNVLKIQDQEATLPITSLIGRVKQIKSRLCQLSILARNPRNQISQIGRNREKD